MAILSAGEPFQPIYGSFAGNPASHIGHVSPGLIGYPYHQSEPYRNAHRSALTFRGVDNRRISTFGIHYSQPLSANNRHATLQDAHERSGRMVSGIGMG
ncbi:MAG: hypothetical protein JWQ98_886 [Chlorobi bacterium]|nr:hypothetical protein [Chlorobiota bacterium]